MIEIEANRQILKKTIQDKKKATRTLAFIKIELFLGALKTYVARVLELALDIYPSPTKYQPHELPNSRVRE